MSDPPGPLVGTFKEAVMKTTILKLSKKLSLVLLSTCLSLALLAPGAALARNHATPTEPAGTSRPATSASAPWYRARPPSSPTQRAATTGDAATAQPGPWSPVSRWTTWWLSWFCGW
jgi:hypothetical protein